MIWGPHRTLVEGACYSQCMEGCRTILNRAHTFSMMHMMHAPAQCGTWGRVQPCQQLQAQAPPRHAPISRPGRCVVSTAATAGPSTPQEAHSTVELVVSPSSARQLYSLAAHPEKQVVSVSAPTTTVTVEAGSLQSPASPDLAALAANPLTWGIVAGVGLSAYAVKAAFDSGSRKYAGNVGQEYDAWTTEGILEYYWGEHIHLGYYSDLERAEDYRKKSFKQAKYDFVDEMLAFSGVQSFSKVLDVGCGFGGSSRHLAKKFPHASIEGITLSPKQVERGTEIAKERGLTNVSFKVMDALAMTYPDNSFDLVWACESGEHMPDKKKYVEEMLRVLKPGGTLVIACWCQREETPDNPLTAEEKKDLQFLYDEWAHPYFISIQEFCRLMKNSGQAVAIASADWTAQTLPSWRHQFWVGIADPWIVISKPHLWYKTARDGITIERMHQAFSKGLMQYGMMRCTKM